MIPSAVRRAIQQAGPAQIYTSPYRAKRLWPPDFSKMSEKQQFRLERKYRRRSKLKWARPGWNKTLKLAQWGSILGIIVYGVLFLDWQQENKPFQGIRNWYAGVMGSIWTRQPDRFQRRDETDDQSPMAADGK